MTEPLSPPQIASPGLFDRESAENSCTLPAAWYHDPAVYRREHETIFYRSWWYQCHVSDIADPGDYVCGSVVDQNIFVIRGHDGALRAFFNVCSHRAHPLLEGSGNARLIVCPYHQWCYQSDGCFRGARGRDALKDWIPENADLKPVRVEVYGGFVFVNLDMSAQPLKNLAPKFLDDMYAVCPRLDSLVRVERIEFDVAANWKTLVDNNHECYHCDANHPSLMDMVDYDNKAVWSDDGITFTHAVERKNLDNKGYAVDPGTIEQDSMFGYIWPVHIPLFYPGTPSMVMFQILPTGPETSRVRHDYFLLNRKPSAQERALIDWFSNTLAREDVGLCERVQKNLHSLGYRQGRFVVDREHPEYSEHHVHFFQRMVHDALMGSGAG